MKKLFLSFLMTGLLSSAFISCKKPDNDNTAGKSCRVVAMKEFEDAQADVISSGVLYRLDSLIYEGNKLIRLDTEVYGEPSGQRFITYEGDLVKEVTFKNKAGRTTHIYTFTWNNETKLPSRVGVQYHIEGFTSHGEYVYEFNNAKQLSNVLYYHNGRISQAFEYEYLENPSNVVEVSVYSLSFSDPSYKEISNKIRYEYDDKKSPFTWPAFSWNQYHNQFFDLVAPPSPHNIKRYTYRVRTSMTNPVIEFETDNSVSFSAAITYNDARYPTDIAEHRTSGSTVVYRFSYKCE